MLSFIAQGEDKALEQRVFIHALNSTGIFQVPTIAQHYPWHFWGFRRNMWHIVTSEN